MRDSIDACLTQAFRDVPVPEGLAERLLAGLAVKRAPSLASLAVGRRRRCLRRRPVFCLPSGSACPGEERFSEQLALDEAIQSF